MKHEAAQHLIQARIDQLSKLSYKDIQALIPQGHRTEESLGEDGLEYQIDIHAFYDDKRLGTIRVSGSAYEPKEHAPWWLFWKNIDSAVASSDFIMRPDGSLVED
jgi:hypothetical protein